MQGYDILDSDDEDAFDQLVRLAALVAGTPMAALAFVDGRREWRKSAVGLNAAEVARPHSLCAQVVADGAELVINDLQASALPSGVEPDEESRQWRFYAGFPLFTADGFALGVLAVMDCTPHVPSMSQLEGLRTLAEGAMAQLEPALYPRQRGKRL